MEESNISRHGNKSIELQMDESTDAYLQANGLPTNTGRENFVFNHESIYNLRFNNRCFLIIGCMYSTLFGVDSSTGVVEAIDFEEDFNYYINSGIEKFIYFVKIYIEITDSIDENNDEDINSKIQYLKEAFKKFDERSVLKNNFWYLVLEQDSFGL